ncbi:flagellin [Shinella sp. SUS2]|jgi:flagellin|uniref:flagellin N-terminal helical domain-containing protein n=1 Tax=unclassified Shinella TaxID=2643062 RepID=UPI000437BA0E|nr:MULTISPECIES: flagellin [unclassified Shinella]MCA0338153.1 flagellin [Pseudomonadota bacterium]EYR82005.1 hook-associated protein [Shinella sp. DD12]KNY14842.1 flagellin [Shinella sp. SUS2]KOC74495.1 flagellin [Shinella sp. GWS1]MDG4672249.1 flagellin [Shinella sp. 838]
MTSILTNVAAMSALQTLRSINNGMEDTQARVSSGLRVGSASDNAAYWSIATTMRSDNMALSAVQDALGLGAAKVDTAYAGMNSSIEVVKEIKKKLVTATEDGVDKVKIQEEITQLQQQLVSISDAASFSGENWLKANVGDNTSVVASFVRDASGNVSVKKVDYALDASTVLFDATGGKAGILDRETSIDGNGIAVNVNIGGTTSTYNVVRYTTAEVIADNAAFDAGGDVAVGGTAGRPGYVKVADDTWVEAIDQSGATDHEIFATDSGGAVWAIDATKLATSTIPDATVSGFTITAATTGPELDDLIQMVDTALEDMTSAAADLGSLGMRIELQDEFVSKLTDSIDKGVARLVEADMNEESTRLKALQTQQQLAIQSLSIANSSSQNILSLFR